ncbi:sel1 repeat family protein [Cupriavidus metallidurans]|uniref:SEL1-like repeat protein n=1 Tax=Cupriavidus metallidurans TaxID=119219 RepID=UPI001F2E1681|nr:sel1 repeat family protein [Cupriavidus metallidurans]
MRIVLAALLTALTLTACSKEISMPTVPDLATVRANLAFTCVYEADHLPPLDPEADVLFKYARYLQKLEGPKDFDDVARYYRIAAAHGHYKANSNLQKLVSEGHASSPLPQRESVALASQLIDAGVPSGYYDIGYYLNLGYGLKQDKEMALRYFRKAADLGNADAQFYVGDLLEPWDKAPDIARQMYQCATDQGFGKAAGILGISLKGDRQYAESIAAFQKGVMAGDTTSVSFLEHGFQGPPPTEELYYLALPNDPERSRRYELIWRFLIRNDGRNPKVPDIDQIVPLPPAKLPPWDGTFQWQKEQDAAVPPDKPSDELINRLSQAKNLDPATGLPLTTSAETAQTTTSAPEQRALPLGTKASTGEQCPQRGLWCVRGAASISGSRREFEKGDVLPPLTVYDPRPFAWMDSLLGMREQSADVTWELIVYSNQA